MSATLTALNESARRLTGDTASAVWTDLQINDWINDAIRDISIHFPRVITTDLSTTLNTREYDLELNFLQPFSVEYPQGEDPPIYLIRRPYTHPLFWQQDGYYDILDTRTSDDTNDKQLYISEKPAASDVSGGDISTQNRELKSSPNRA